MFIKAFLNCFKWLWWCAKLFGEANNQSHIKLLSHLIQFWSCWPKIMLNNIIVHWSKILSCQTCCTSYISCFAICISHWWNRRNASFVWWLPFCSWLSHKTCRSLGWFWNWIASTIKNTLYDLWIFNASSMGLVQYFVKFIWVINLSAFTFCIFCWS